MPPSTSMTDAKMANPSSKYSEWSPSSWRQKKAKQQPVYTDEAKHQKALEKLETLPPLVTPTEVLPTYHTVLMHRSVDFEKNSRKWP